MSVFALITELYFIEKISFASEQQQLYTSPEVIAAVATIYRPQFPVVCRMLTLKQIFNF